MQVIIDIPESDIPKQQCIIEIPLHFIDGKVCEVGGYAFNVLPKGHGVLKDVTNLMRGLYTDIQTVEELFISSDVYKMIDEECPTVIEADKEADE